MHREVARHGQALVADFAEVYGLRLTDVVRDYHPAEAVALVAGLLTTRSRYAARLQGHTTGLSWNDRDYLALDHRHATEGLRALVTDALSKGKNDSTFRQWTHVPGALAAKAKQIRSKFDSYRKLANNE